MSCFKNNCAIHVEDVEVPEYGPGYEILLQMDPDGGIECSDGEGGIRVKLDPSAANLITRGAGGGLLAQLPDAQGVDQIANTNDYVSVPHTADSGAAAVTPVVLSYTNATQREQLILARASLRFNFDIIRNSANLPTNGAPGATSTIRRGPINFPPPSGSAGSAPYDGNLALLPFNTQPQMQLQRRINGGAWNAVVAEKDAIGGMIYASNPAQNEQKQWWETVEHKFALAAGAVVEYRGAMFYEGPSQNLNVTATPAGNSAGDLRGFAVSLASLLALPLGEV